MKNRIFILFIVLSAISMFSCKSKNYDTEKKNRENGKNSLLQQTSPQKGEIILELEKVLSFEPSKTNPDALELGRVKKDIYGNYYFYSPSKVEILKYDKNGKFVKSFLRKGQGPSELPYIMFFNVEKNGVYVSDGHKVIKFDFDGNVVFEKRLKTNCFPIVVRDDKTIIGTFYDKESIKNKKPKKKLALLNMEGYIIKDIISTDKTGQIVIKTGKMFMAFMIPGAVPSLVWAYDKKNDIVYYANSDKYTIYSINLKTGERFSFGKKYKDLFLSASDKKKMADSFSNTSEDLRKAFAKQLPNRRMPIISFKILPSGYLTIITPLKGLENTVDIFDNKGNYIYRIKKIRDDLDFTDFDFFNDGHLGYIEEKEEGTVFTEYKAKKPAEIFKKDSN